MDEKLCSGGRNKPQNWLGGRIILNHNGEKIGVLPYGFTDFEKCVIAGKEDEFQLERNVSNSTDS